MLLYKHFILAIIILFTTIALSQNEVAKKEYSGAVIEFEKSEHDFGTVEAGKIVEHIFKFTNIGNDTLYIKKVDGGWGCTAALLSSKVIAPGGTGEIKVSFDTKNRRNKNKKSIKVYSNDSVKRLRKLTIKAFVNKKTKNNKL